MHTEDTTQLQTLRPNVGILRTAAHGIVSEAEAEREPHKQSPATEEATHKVVDAGIDIVEGAFAALLSIATSLGRIADVRDGGRAYPR